MKIKITIFSIALLVISANVFGQKTESKPPVKTPETAPSPAAKLPTVKEVLDKYVQALGGREANEKIQTRVMKGTVELAPMGVKGTGEVYQAAPDKSYNKITLGGIGDLIEAYDGTTAWAINPIQGNRDKTGSELLQTKLAAAFHRELNFEKLYPKMQVKGIEKIGDKEAYVIFAEPTGLDPQTFYFDRQTGLLLREDATLISPEGKTSVKTFYEDYREIDGIKLPFKIRAVMPQFEATTVMTDVKNSVKIDESLFSKPKQ
jgi:hypothetical protein